VVEREGGKGERDGSENRGEKGREIKGAWEEIVMKKIDKEREAVRSIEVSKQMAECATG
jgi:hypothetical protein